MAAYFPTPPAKKPTTAFQPRRGKIKAQIFGGIAEAVASAASRALDFLGLVKNDDTSATALMVADGGGDEGAIVHFIIVEKDP